MTRRAWSRAATYAFFAVGAIGWVYTGLVMAPAAPFGAVACGLLALISAAGPLALEEFSA